jgi:hypothetical protein
VKLIKRFGKFIKRTAAKIAIPALGPGLGEKVAVKIAATAGKPAQKSLYKDLSNISMRTGQIVKVGATAVATWFGGPMAGKAANQLTGTIAKAGRSIVQKELYARGYSARPAAKVGWNEFVTGGMNLLRSFSGQVSDAVGVSPDVVSGVTSDIGRLVSPSGGAAGPSGGAGADLRASAPAGISPAVPLLAGGGLLVGLLVLRSLKGKAA